MLESTIICQKCKKELKPIGEESLLDIGFNEHYFCEDCQVNISVVVRFNKTEEEKETESI